MFVGNDIVAYKHQRCIGKWRDDFFLQKVLFENEINTLQHQENKDAFLWTLWTLKEAAYKLSCFLGNRNKFHPRQFEVLEMDLTDTPIHNIPLPISNNVMQLHNVLSKIVYNQATYFGYSFVTHQYIHSIVSNELLDMKRILFGIGEHTNYNKDDYSTEVRFFAKQNLINSNIQFREIEKDKDGIPFLLLNDHTTQYISLSHDQQFVSFAIVASGELSI